ncbi:MAG: nucleotidyltransferase family protein [Spirochaetia bacterium]
MESHYTEVEAETIRAYVRGRRVSRKNELAARLVTARRDRDAIVSVIAGRYRPSRIYLWGSLVDDRHFSEMSDIDIALEGITDPVELSEIRSTAEKLTRLPLDIVAIEHVHPAYAEHIRRRGRVAYER